MRFRSSSLVPLLHLLHHASGAGAAANLERSMQQQQDSYGFTEGQDGKHLPERASPNCTLWETDAYLNRNDIPFPCRQPNNGGNDGSTATPPDGIPPDPNNDQPGLDPANPGEQDQNNGLDGRRNRVRITLFVGIRPYRPNIEPIVTAVVTKWLNSTIQNMDFYLYSPSSPSNRKHHRNRHLQLQRYYLQQQRNLNLRGPRQAQDDQILGGGFGNGDQVLGVEGGGGGGGFLDINQADGGGGGANNLRKLDFTMIHFDTESELVVRTKRQWYWKHTVVYECLWREDSSPVINTMTIQNVTNNVTQALMDGEENRNNNAEDTNTGGMEGGGLVMTLRQRSGDEGVTITIKPEELPEDNGSNSGNPNDPPPTGPMAKPGDEFAGGSTPAPSLPPTPFDISSNPRGGGLGGLAGDNNGVEGFYDPTYPVPLDSQDWDWRRYLGLVLFLGTILGTCVLSQVHSYRQRRLIKSQVWGNLASEEGVNELLKTGWKVQTAGTSSKSRRDVMEIYDKSKWGYKEDDSMLIGGFEQREAVVGAEITLTHAETHSQNVSTTQDTHHTPPSPQHHHHHYPSGTIASSAVTPVHHYGTPPSTPPHDRTVTAVPNNNNNNRSNNNGAPRSPSMPKPPHRSRF